MPPWLVIAWGEINVAEVPGAGNNPRILEYHKRTKLRAKADIVPWCAAFVCWCLEEAGLISPASARAADFLTWGRPVEKPVEGCVVIFHFPNGSFHVGFYVAETPKVILCLGGNQRDAVQELGFKKAYVVGYRMPIERAWQPPVTSPDPTAT